MECVKRLIPRRTKRSVTLRATSFTNFVWGAARVYVGVLLAVAFLMLGAYATNSLERGVFAIGDAVAAIQVSLPR